MKKKYKATAALAVSIAGAAGTTGLAQTGFLGGMVHNGFLAATIGGLADWFAITALFRKPLGISYRTEIIIRNRQRIMQAVVDFAANDLLATENIMKFVNQQDLGGFLTIFVRKYGQEKLMPHVEKIAVQMEQELSAEAVAKLMAPHMKNLLTDDLLESMAGEMLAGLSHEEQSKRLLYVLAEGLEQLLKDQKLKQLLAEYMEELLTEYGNAVTSRAFVIGLLGLSGNKLADQLSDKIAHWLSELSQNPAREAQAVDWLSDKLKQLSQKDNVVQLLAQMMAEKLTEERLQNILQDVLESILSKGALSRQLVAWAEGYLQQFLANTAWQQQADSWLKKWLADELGKHHDIITHMIEERLSQLSDKELVEFTEAKVADDLQMIRINGSVIGSLVGMGLYAIVYLAGQVLWP